MGGRGGPESEIARADERVIVVGTGPTAAAAVTALTHRGVPCLVVNSGSVVPDGMVVKLRSRTLYRRDRGHGFRTLDDPRGSSGLSYHSNALGGLSNYWTAASPRFDPGDFHVHAAADRRWEWPVTADELDPWYSDAERVLGLTGAAEPEYRGRNRELAHVRRTPGDWRRVMGRLPFDCQLTTSAIGPPDLIARRPREYDSYRCVLEPMERFGTIEIRSGLRVRRVLWDPREGRARGIEAVDGDTGRWIRIRGRHVILCAGTIGTLGILAASRTDDHPTGMGDSAGLLGTHVTDHLRMWFELHLDRPLPALDHPVQIRRPATQAGDHPWQQSVGLAPSHAERIRALLRQNTTRFGVNTFGSQLPTPDDMIRFAEDGEVLAFEASYRADAIRDLESSREQLADALSDIGLPARPTTPHIDDRPGSSVHWSGGARMHRDPALGVVDPCGEVWDAPGVSVGDASVFPTLPEKNPTLTSMALSMRAAAHLADGGTRSQRRADAAAPAPPDTPLAGSVSSADRAGTVGAR